MLFPPISNRRGYRILVCKTQINICRDIIMLLVLYVDDIVVARSDPVEVEIVKADFKKRFEM